MLALKLEWFAFGELAAGSFDHNSISHLDLCGTSGVSLFSSRSEGARCAARPSLRRPGAGGGHRPVRRRAADNRDRALDPRVRGQRPHAGYSGLALGWSTREHRGPRAEPTDLVSIADYPVSPPLRAPPALLIYNGATTAASPPRRPGSVYDPVAPLYQRFFPGVEFAFHQNTVPGTQTTTSTTARRSTAS